MLLFPGSYDTPQVRAWVQGPVQRPGPAAQPVPGATTHPARPVGGHLEIHPIPRSGCPAPGPPLDCTALWSTVAQELVAEFPFGYTVKPGDTTRCFTQLTAVL